MVFLFTSLNSTRSWVCCLFSACSSAILILLLLIRLKRDKMSRKRALRRPSYVRYVKGPDLDFPQERVVFSPVCFIFAVVMRIDQEQYTAGGDGARCEHGGTRSDMPQRR